MNAAKVNNYDETINNIQRLLEESKKLDDIYKKKTRYFTPFLI